MLSCSHSPRFANGLIRGRGVVGRTAQTPQKDDLCCFVDRESRPGIGWLEARRLSETRKSTSTHDFRSCGRMIVVVVVVVDPRFESERDFRAGLDPPDQSDPHPNAAKARRTPLASRSSPMRLAVPRRRCPSNREDDPPSRTAPRTAKAAARVGRRESGRSQSASTSSSAELSGA